MGGALVMQPWQNCCCSLNLGAGSLGRHQMSRELSRMIRSELIMEQSSSRGIHVPAQLRLLTQV